MMREIAHVKGYDDLIEAIRTRLSELNGTVLAVDTVAGLPSGYTGKLLGAKRVKRYGLTSLGPTLEALGVRLIMVADGEAERRYAAMLRDTRQRSTKGVGSTEDMEKARVLGGLLADYRLRTLMSEMAKIYGSIGGTSRMGRLTKEKRRRLARQAGKASAAARRNAKPSRQSGVRDTAPPCP
jgi:hypothetical protein